MDLKVIIKSENKTILRSKLKGTTFSGHATRTTLGNSLRVLCYVCFIFEELGYHDVFWMKNNDVRVFVAGDDVLIKCTSEAAKLFDAYYKAYFDTEVKPNHHGFG